VLEASGITAGAGPGMKARPPRKNVMLAATIAAGPVSAPVRIRNLSEAGAMIDGPALPDVGSTLTLNRLELSIGATVVWSHGGRCGLTLEGSVVVDDWISGVRTTANRTTLGQLRVDQIQAAIRNGAVLPSAAYNPVPEKPPAEPLERRIAAELARVKKALDAISDELTDDVDILVRHQRILQNFDIAAMVIEEIAEVMAAENPERALAEVKMHDLRSRLSGRQTLI
jgi:hypothetical protein